MKALLFANTDWYLYNFRLPLAQALRERGWQVILVSPPGEYAPRLQSAGFEWHSFPFLRQSLNPLAELVTLTRLIGLYRALRPNLAHHFTIKPVLYGSLAARFSGARAINAITGLGHVFIGGSPLLRFAAQSFYRLALRGSAVIFQNQDDQELFARLRLTKSAHPWLIPGSGIDLARFSPLPFPDSAAPLIVLPGRLLHSKGVREFVQAAQSLKTHHPQARFALVGDPDFGNPDSVTREELNEWQRQGNVELWGWRSDMRQVYAQASLVCLPSYREGLSRTLLEAAASGRPIVTSDVPGCREIVRPGQNGLLAPAGDSAALAAALEALLNHPQEWPTLAAAGRRHVEENFSLERVLEMTLKVYEESL